MPNSKICVSEKSVLSNSVWSMLTKLFRSVRSSLLYKGQWLVCLLHFALSAKYTASIYNKAIFYLLHIIFVYLKQKCVGSTNLLPIWYFFPARSFSFHLPVFSASSWQGLFFVYFRVISQKFVSTLLRKRCGFFQWFLAGIPLILALEDQNLWI